MWYSINGNFCFALFCFFFFKGGIDLSLFLGQEKKQILDGKVRGNNWWKFCQYTGREMKSRSWRERAHSSPEEGKLMLTCWVRNGQVLDRFMVQFSQVIGRQKRWEGVVELEACGTTWKFRFCMKEREMNKEKRRAADQCWQPEYGYGNLKYTHFVMLWHINHGNVEKL